MKDKQNINNFLKRSITVTFSVVILLLFIALPSSCKKKDKPVQAITDRQNLPTMSSTGVVTLVSDSGMIRYKMVAGEWTIFDKKTPSYWAFENGIHLERFDSLTNVDAYIDADTAYYYDKDKLWELRSNVKIENVKGEKFTTNLLFWNQVTEKIYSDAFITIYSGDQVLSGYGFESDQRFEDYDIKRTSGVFYIENKEEDE